MAQVLGFDLNDNEGGSPAEQWTLQRSHTWQLVMPHDINGISGLSVSEYCQDIRFEDYNISEVYNLRYGAKQRFFAGLQNINAVSLKFLIPTDKSVYRYFYGWSNLIIDERGYYYPKNHYKKTIYIMLYNMEGENTEKFTLKGVFPRNKPGHSLSYASEEMLTWEAILSIDDVKPE